MSEAVRTLMLNGEWWGSMAATGVCCEGFMTPCPPPVGVLPFAHICTLLGAHSPLSEGEVLEELQRVCVLVQGCWVVHSSVLYPKDYTSPHNCVCSDVLCRARDNAVGKSMWAGLSLHGAGLQWGMHFVFALLPLASSISLPCLRW